MQRLRTLFLCTGNSARSVLAEWILRQRAPDRFEVASAGAEPRGVVHPLAVEVLQTHFHVDATQARSKSWQELADQRFDLIITLCDKARETCGAWRGRPVTAHWNLPDPAAVEGPLEVRRQAFVDVATQVAARIGFLCVLRDDQVDALRLNAIGQGAPLPAEPA